MEIQHVTWNVGDRVEVSDSWRKLQELSRAGWEVKSSHSFLLKGISYVTVILQRTLDGSPVLPRSLNVTGNTGTGNTQYTYRSPYPEPELARKAT